ncbi:MAG: DUF2384 domain-containing protein [Desulfobacteraceae bacterium]|nr:DUF2384 domain-containing protein [Desulfobacteraceae bacterium]
MIQDFDYIPTLRAKSTRDAITNALVASIPSSESILPGVQTAIKKKSLAEQLKPVNQVITFYWQDHSNTPTIRPDPFPAKSLMKIFQGGLSGQLFLYLCKLLDIPEKRLSDIISLPQSTLNKRKKRGYFSPTESERLYRILKLFKRAVEVFDNNPAHARKWLKSEAFGLDGAVPLDFAKSEIGAREVDNLLTRIDEGIFA